MTISFIYALIPAMVVAVIALIAVSIVAEHKHEGGGSGMRAAYFYSVSAISLGIMLGASLFIIYQGFTHWVFPNAAPTAIVREGPPPVPQLDVLEPNVDGAEATTVTCTDDCALTESEQTAIESWTVEYDDWTATVENNTQIKRDLINAFSFLIVAIPVFWFHFRYVRRTKDREAARPIRATYFYGMSIISMVIAIVSVGFLLNSLLGAWIAPENDQLREYFPPAAGSTEQSAIATVQSCEEPCALSETAIADAEKWDTDNARWEAASGAPVSQRQELASSMLAALLVAVPTFWYHFATARKETSNA